MSIRTIAAAALSAIALAGGVAVTGAPQAEAVPVTCMPAKPTIQCSMYWANRTNYAARYNVRNAEVVALQRALTQAKFTVGITGHYNTYTVKAVKAYQASRGLTVTGALDYKTLGWMRVGAGPRKITVSPTSTTKAARAVKFAHAQIGKPYGYGGTGPSSYDCSGLTQAAWRSAGVSVPRTSYSQLKLTNVSRANLRPGDIVGYYKGSHVGIYVGNGYIVHASRPGQPIAKVSINLMPYLKAVRPAS